MTAYLFLLLLLTTTLILGVGVMFLSRMKRMAEELPKLGAQANADDERKFLAENWTLVEKTALEHGMSADELAELRRKVFGAVG